MHIPDASFASLRSTTSEQASPSRRDIRASPSPTIAPGGGSPEVWPFRALGSGLAALPRLQKLRGPEIELEFMRCVANVDTPSRLKQLLGLEGVSQDGDWNPAHVIGQLSASMQSRACFALAAQHWKVQPRLQEEFRTVLRQHFALVPGAQNSARINSAMALPELAMLELVKDGMSIPEACDACGFKRGADQTDFDRYHVDRLNLRVATDLARQAVSVRDPQDAQQPAETVDGIMARLGLDERYRPVLESYSVREYWQGS